MFDTITSLWVHLTCQHFISVIVEVNLWLPEQSLDFYWLQMHFWKSGQLQLIRGQAFGSFIGSAGRCFFLFLPAPPPYLSSSSMYLWVTRLRITLKNMSPRPQWFVYLSPRYNHVMVVSGYPITGQSPDFSAHRRRPNLHSNQRKSVSNNRQGN